MRIVDIALKDLVEIVRDKKSVVFLVLMPVAFTLFFGFAFRSAEEDPRLPVGWVNGDAPGELTAGLGQAIEAAGATKLVPVDEAGAAGAQEQVRNGALAGIILVPQGFSAAAAAGEAPPLTVIVPNTMAGQTATTSLQAAAKRVLGAVEAARLSVAAVEAQSPFDDEAARQAALEKSLAQARAAWQQPGLTIELEPATGAQGAGEARNSTPPSGFQQSSPGMIVQFAVFSLITSSMILVIERRAGVLRRLMTAPIRRAEVVGGHLVAMFSVVFLQGLMLVALGQIGFGVDYLREPVATLLMVGTLGLWVTGLGLLVGALARKEEQVVALSLIGMFLFAALGGAWFPLEIAGEAFETVGHLMPTAWAMGGLQNIIIRGLGLESVLQPAAVLLAYAAAFFGLAVWRFRFD